MGEDPLPKKIILCIAAILIGLILPRAVITKVDIYPESCDNCAWDSGTIKVPVLVTTEISTHNGLPIALNKKPWQGNGTCVPYARNRTGIELYGWAGTFLDRAPEAGYTISTEPIVGAMVITNESRGHAAVVEDIDENTIDISEQNYAGPYIISGRKLDISDPRILGYIY